MTARLVGITAILIVSGAVLGWLFADPGHRFDVRTILPFLGGQRITLFDWAGLALIGVGLWGLGRLYSAVRTDDATTTSGEVYEQVTAQDEEEDNEDE